MFRILTAVLLLPRSLGPNLRRIANPQREVLLRQYALEPPRVPRRFHPRPHAASVQVAIEALCFLFVSELPRATFSRFPIYKRDLLNTWVIVTAYNQHTRLLSFRAFGR